MTGKARATLPAIAEQIGGDSINLPSRFGLHAQLIFDTAMRLTQEKDAT
jgi:hypothetical protein